MRRFLALTLPAAAAPDEELLGKSAGYPIGTRANWYHEESVRVGSFSSLDRIPPHSTLENAASPLPLLRAAGEPSIEQRRFALLGIYGQSIFVDPELKLVLVITGAAKTVSGGNESLSRERDAPWRGVIRKYGSW